MNDGENDDIKFKADATTGHALKILLLLMVFILPFIVVFSLQGYIIDMWGEPSPTSPFYLMLLGVLILWFVIGYIIIIPRVRTRIDARYGTN